MNIIFGDRRNLVPDSYTVLELDTIRRAPDFTPHKAYCLLEFIPLHELPQLEQLIDTHNQLLTLYRQQHWEQCESLIHEQLRGRWNGEVDSFYEELLKRMQLFRTQPPGADWDGSLVISQPG